MINFEKVQMMISSKNEDTVYMAAKLLESSLYEGNIVARNLLAKIPLIKRIKSYSDVCKELKIKELTLKDFEFLPENQQLKLLALHKLKNIEKLFNDNWNLNWKDRNQQKWYPWFEEKGSGLVFNRSGYDRGASDGVVAYFKDQLTSDYIGKTFLDLYKIILE